MYKLTAKEAFNIPNMLGYFRIILIPIFTYMYYNARIPADYYYAAAVVAVSGITDLLDGFIARKFDMVTEFGKFLDPLADKLTQCVLIVCLASRFKYLWILVALFLIKEGYMAIKGLLMIKKGKKLDGAKWFGKVCTTGFYIVMFILMLLPGINIAIANTLIAIVGALMLLAFILYIPEFKKL